MNKVSRVAGLGISIAFGTGFFSSADAQELKSVDSGCIRYAAPYGTPYNLPEAMCHEDEKDSNQMLDAPRSDVDVSYYGSIVIALSGIAGIAAYGLYKRFDSQNSIDDQFRADEVIPDDAIDTFILMNQEADEIRDATDQELVLAVQSLRPWTDQ